VKKTNLTIQIINATERKCWMDISIEEREETTPNSLIFDDIDEFYTVLRMKR